MLHSVRDYLSKFGKPDEKILAMIDKVDRKDFMIENLELAYEDEAVPIGYQQTISQPSTVARMISLLELKKSDTILEIGTGSLWNAAVMAQLSKKVTTLEIVNEFIERAENIIKRLKIKNIEVKNMDFRKVDEKFNKIIFTAGISKNEEDTIEEFAKNHLKENGILLCPYRSGQLIVMKKQKSSIIKIYTKDEYGFVPLILD